MTLGLYGPVLYVLYNFAVSVRQLTNGLELFFFTHVESAVLNTEQILDGRKTFKAGSHPSIGQRIPNFGFWILNKL